MSDFSYFDKLLLHKVLIFFLKLKLSNLSLISCHSQ
ncbi:unnamed protein product [Brassica rapa subsp. trilocularis]